LFGGQLVDGLTAMACWTPLARARLAFTFLVNMCAGESPMQPADVYGEQGGIVGLESMPGYKPAPTQYATLAPACTAEHTFDEMYMLSNSIAPGGAAEESSSAAGPYAGLPPALVAAFTLDGRRDLWILPDCPTVLDILRPLSCIPPQWPDWLWCKWTKGGGVGYGQALPQMMPVRRFEFETAWSGPSDSPHLSA